MPKGLVAISAGLQGLRQGLRGGQGGERSFLLGFRPVRPVRPSWCVEIAENPGKSSESSKGRDNLVLKKQRTYGLWMSNDLSDEVIVVIYSATLPIDMDMILTTCDNYRSGI